MSDNKDRYADDSDQGSQVRNIIKQLNEERPSREKKREVVVRPDGTKVVRVVKKRKVMVTHEEKSRRARRSFLSGLLAFILLLAAAVGFYAYRMSSMSSDDYLRGQEVALCKAWGATSVRCVGAHIDGMELMADSIVAEFPESSRLERVELSKISCTLETASFIFGTFRSDEVKIAQANIRMRADARDLEIPRWQGEELWRFKRVACDSLDFSIGDSDNSPLVISGTDAYMYFPNASAASRVIILSGGLLKMRGWKPINLDNGKLQVSTNAVEDIRLTGTTDAVDLDKDDMSSSVTISGRISAGDPLAGPFMLDTDNMNFADFTGGKFASFFGAKTVSAALGKKKPAAYVTLPIEADRPEFKGFFKLKDIRLTSFPALMELASHIEPAKRKAYLPPKILQGRVEVLHEDGSVILNIAENEMKQLDLISLSGRVSVDGNNTLSGTLNYGIPALLTHVEYPDGAADPIFVDDGVLAWLRTHVFGQANAPMDNSKELDAKAEEARLSRPARTPFDQLDVDTFSRRMQAEHADEQEMQPQGGGEQGTTPPGGSKSNNSGNPFAEPDNPFESGDNGLQLPSGGGLTLPVDSSVFPSA